MAARLWHTWRTARRRHHCESGRGTSDCAFEIKRGDRYVRSAGTPNADLGNLGWLNQNLCAPCARSYGSTDPRAEES